MCIQILYLCNMPLHSTPNSKQKYFPNISPTYPSLWSYDNWIAFNIYNNNLFFLNWNPHSYSSINDHQPNFLLYWTISFCKTTYCHWGNSQNAKQNHWITIHKNPHLNSFLITMLHLKYSVWMSQLNFLWKNTYMYKGYVYSNSKSLELLL